MWSYCESDIVIAIRACVSKIIVVDMAKFGNLDGFESEIRARVILMILAKRLVNRQTISISQPVR